MLFRSPWLVGFLSMLLISCSALAIQSSFDRIEHLLGYFLSVSAGVAPVFILRWVWNRISAWSQFSAMLGSAAFTISYPLIDSHLDVLDSFRYDDRRLIFVTMATSISWLVVTMLAPQKSKPHLFDAHQRTQLIRRLIWSILAGAGLIALLTMCLWLWS